MSRVAGAARSYLDANVLISFAVVGQLSLLSRLFGSGCRWTDAVAREVAAHTPHVVDSGLCGEPIVVEGLAAALAVEDLRFRLSGQSTGTKDLGEAQCLHLARQDGGTFVTDDRAAADFARSLAVTVMDSADVLRECFAANAIGCPDAHDLLVAMAERGRGVRVPPSHHHVC